MQLHRGRACSNSFQRVASSKYGAAVAGAGTRRLAIGAGGEADGFPRIARLTIIIADGGPTADGVPTALGKALGVHTAIGEARTEVGTARSQLLRA